MTIDQPDEAHATSVDSRRASIQFRLDPSSGVPTYLQLVQQVEHSVRLGHLARGDKLPTVRDVVGTLAINPNTVMKAYRELEHRGLASGRPGQGTFITGELAQVSAHAMRALRDGLTSWLAMARESGLDDSGITALFADVWSDHQADASSEDDPVRRVSSARLDRSRGSVA